MTDVLQNLCVCCRFIFKGKISLGLKTIIFTSIMPKVLEHSVEGAEWSIPLRQMKPTAGLLHALTGNHEQHFLSSISVPLCWTKGTKVKIGKSQLEHSVFHLVVKSFCLMHSLTFEGRWLQI